MSKTGPGLSDIAAQAGVSRMTVSLALRNSPRILPETTERIRKIARELGYSPDPRMAAAMARVRDAKKKELQPLAWINANSNRNAFSEYKWLSPYIDGAQEMCHELGYRLDEFWLREPGMTERRLSSILSNRGIRGVIVTPTLPSITHLRLDWRQFASVSLENAILLPRLHRVVPDYYYNIMLTLKMLRRLGYRRVGLCVQQLEARRSHHSYQGALRVFHASIPRTERTAPLIFRPFDFGEFSRWLKTQRPDVIIGHHSRMVEWLSEAGLRVPEDIGVAHLSLDEDCADWAGIWQHKRRIGAQVVEQVVSMIHNNRTGLPDLAYETLVPGAWRHGWTLRKRE
ncbi:transcriptional regulator [Opitutaceae bacterium TAV1]|nr:transcriptional regulator [Opitutaceae bacterium TAV1]